jgi:hypothetical protein
VFKYTSKYCVMGMAGKYEVLGDFQGLRKNRNQAISFDAGFDPGYKKVLYSYIYDTPDCKRHKSTQLVSNFTDSYFNLAGKEHREVRESRNKFNKLIAMREYNKEDVLGLIDLWDTQSGTKYGWQRHSGYDRSFFTRWFDAERDNLFSRFFYLGDKMVGYSVLHKGEGCWEYLIRKTDNTIRNTCLYVDYKTFEELHKIEESFLVNWGASKGSLLEYKRKFPCYEENNVYFYYKTNPTV